MRTSHTQFELWQNKVCLTLWFNFMMLGNPNISSNHQKLEAVSVTTPVYSNPLPWPLSNNFQQIRTMCLKGWKYGTMSSTQRESSGASPLTENWNVMTDIITFLQLHFPTSHSNHNDPTKHSCPYSLNFTDLMLTYPFILSKFYGN